MYCFLVNGQSQLQSSSHLFANKRFQEKYCNEAPYVSFVSYLYSNSLIGSVRRHIEDTNPSKRQEEFLKRKYKLEYEDICNKESNLTLLNQTLSENFEWLEKEKMQCLNSNTSAKLHKLLTFNYLLKEERRNLSWEASYLSILNGACKRVESEKRNCANDLLGLDLENLKNIFLEKDNQKRCMIVIDSINNFLSKAKGSGK